MKLSPALRPHIGILLVIFICSINGSFLAQDNQKIDWLKDLEYLKTELPLLHSNLFFDVSQDEYNASIENLKKQAGIISDDAMYIKIQQLIVRMGDSHTSTGFISKLPQQYLPIVLYAFSEGIFIVGVMDIDESIMGNKLISINGHPLNTVMDSLKTLYVAENESWHKRKITSIMANYSVLKYFGFVNKEKVKLQLENYYGISEEVVVKPVEIDEIKAEDLEFIKFSGRKNKRPKTTEIFGHKYMPKDSMYFVIYNRCTGRENEQMNAIRDSMEMDMNDYCTRASMKNEKTKVKKDVKPLPYFRLFRDSIFQTVQSQPIKKLVFDLSQNSGGITSQGSLMIAKLAQMVDTTKTKVYVIVGRKTFSAGLIHAMELKRLLNATIVGEPTGGKPSFFGGSDSRYLPSSCLRVSFAQSQRKTTLDQAFSSANTLTPDVIFPVTFESTTSGIDPIFTWILNQK